MCKGILNTHYIFLLLVCGLGFSVQMTVAMQPSISMTDSTDETSRGLPYASNVFPRIISPANLMAMITTPRREGLSLSGQACEGKESCIHHYNDLGKDIQSQACHRRVKSASGYLPEHRSGGKNTVDDEDCCDDICYECCCVKDSCICCGTSLLIAGIFWLKSITSSVQE